MQDRRYEPREREGYEYTANDGTVCRSVGGMAHPSVWAYISGPKWVKHIRTGRIKLHVGMCCMRTCGDQLVLLFQRDFECEEWAECFITKLAEDAREKEQSCGE